MSTFYKIDSTHFTFREYWWGSPSPLVLLAWLVKLLRIRIPGSMDDPPIETLQPHEVSFDQFPEDVRAKFQFHIDELAANGFHSPIFHFIDDQLHDTRIYWATFCDQSGKAFARIHHRIWRRPHPPKVYLFPIFVSGFPDGTFLVSSAGKPDSAAPKTVRTVRKRNASATDLWTLHQQELAKELQTKTVFSTATPDDVRALSEHYHAASRDFHLRRKAWRLPTPAETKEAETSSQAQKTYETQGLAHAEVLAEMDKLQQRKSGWGNAILILVISLLVFVGAGSARWSWKFVLALIPILLFHEFGHYVAMRIFKYRNLRMFFIPFFGAAVSGQNYNVAGWKKAIVSLMGPLPGIFVGALVGCAGLLLHQPLLIKAATLTLILNGFNLLPVLPLDGGWVMHAALFSRHYMLDTAFRVLAALALVVGGYFSTDHILMYLGIFMLIATPISFKVARIASDLRRRGLAAASPDDQNIPPETAQAIVGELKTAFPRGMNTKSLAQHALNIFESLNARPPGWLATTALLGVHGFAFLVAGAFTLAFIVGQQTDLGGFARAAAALPRHTLNCASISTAKNNPDQDAPAHNTIIATFHAANEAQRSLASLQSDLPPNAHLTLFGESIILELPASDDAARKKSIAQIQKQTTNFLVDSTNFHATFRLACIAPDERTAKSIEDDAQNYFAGVSLHLIPPWAAADARSAADREGHRRARRTFLKLEESQTVYRDPALLAIQKNITQAQRQGDAAEAKKLQDQFRQVRLQLVKEQMNGLRRDNTLDLAFIDLYSGLPPRTYTNSDYNAALLKLGAKMGQLPLAGDRPSAADDGFSARWGGIKRNGLLVTFNYLSFQRISEGAPALVQWLCSKKCVDFKYTFSSGLGLESLADE